jgi:Repeat of unknown function (DUF5648)
MFSSNYHPSEVNGIRPLRSAAFTLKFLCSRTWQFFAMFCIVCVILTSALSFAQAPLLPQTITGFAPPAMVIFGAAPLTLTATGGASGEPVVFATSSAPTVCTIATNVVTFEGIGACSVTANQSASGAYAAAAQVVAVIVIGPATPTLKIDKYPASVSVGEGSDYFFFASSNSAGFIEYSAAVGSACRLVPWQPISASQCRFPAVCPFGSNQIQGIGAGICTIVATQSAQGNYAAASVTQSVPITKAVGQVRFDKILPFESAVVGIGRFNLSSPYYTNRLGANPQLTGFTTYSTTSLPSICTVADSIVTVVGAGKCVVIAKFAGDANYEAAEGRATLTIYDKVNPFSFIPVANVPLDTQITSNTVTITGITVETPIRIYTLYGGQLASAGGVIESLRATYSIGCTDVFVSTPSMIQNGQTVCVRLTPTASNFGYSYWAILVIGVTETAFQVTPQDPTPQNRYRIFVPSTGGHLFTTDKREYEFLIKQTETYIDEGIDHKIWKLFLARDGIFANPYYRLYIKPVRQHFWTSDQVEYNTLRVQTDLFIDEGIDGYIFLTAGVANSIPLYRMVLNNTAIHHWTTDKNEFDFLVRTGSWTPEGRPGNPSGVTGYVMPK